MMDAKHFFALMIYFVAGVLTVNMVWVVVLWTFAALFTFWFFIHKIKYGGLIDRLIYVAGCVSPALITYFTEFSINFDRLVYLFGPFVVVTIAESALMIRNHHRNGI